MEHSPEILKQLLEFAAVYNDVPLDELQVCQSSHMRALKDLIGSITGSLRSDNDLVILIVGERGVGKQRVARYIHQNVFGKNHPFLAYNCGDLQSDKAFEQLIYGGEQNPVRFGLFELGGSGTVVLEDIHELTLKMQEQLLSILQSRIVRRIDGSADIAVKAQVIATTHRDLSKAVSQGQFREDLFYKLNTLPISVAPLRSRPEDIEYLARHFLKTLRVSRDKRIADFSPNALKVLKTYKWPGNIRELRNVIERAITLEKGPLLELSQLRQETLQLVQRTDEPATVSLLSQNGYGFERGLTTLRKEMDEKLVRQVLLQTLSHEKGNVSAVARMLKLDRANLLRLLRRFAIDPSLFRVPVDQVYEEQNSGDLAQKKAG